MFIRSIKIFCLVTIVSFDLFPQTSRTDGLAGLSFSIDDKDHSISVFDFGGNPAGLSADEKESLLKIGTSYKNNWGEYRRKYDPEGSMITGIAFQEIRNLGERGTFSGSTSYDYENRRNYYRSVKRDPYNGESFFFTDTTAADFRYMGPTVDLMYSWEPISDISLGGSITYQLLDGLKKEFTFAKSTFRDAEIQAGITAALSDKLTVGGTIKYIDSQESIEASDVNLMDVELYYFRGDNLFISKRSGSMTGKIKKHGVAYGTQLVWDNGTILVGLQGNYLPSDSRLFKPFSSSSQVFNEAEDSYAAFEHTDIQLKCQLVITEKCRMGVTSSYMKNSGWSKISAKDLLVWKWSSGKISMGAGGSYQLGDDLMAAVEYEICSTETDSSKFIDAKNISRSSVDQRFRAGTEYRINDGNYVRAGFSLTTQPYDMIFGGTNCATHLWTIGAGIVLTDQITADAALQYQQRSASMPLNVTRSYINGLITLTLRTF